MKKKKVQMTKDENLVEEHLKLIGNQINQKILDMIRENLVREVPEMRGEVEVEVDQAASTQTTRGRIQFTSQAAAEMNP